MSLTVWWATELYPDNNEESIGIAGDFPVIRLDDMRGVVEGLERIAQPDQTELRQAKDEIDGMRIALRILNRGRDEAERLLAQLKEVGG